MSLIKFKRINSSIPQSTWKRTGWNPLTCIPAIMLVLLLGGSRFSATTSRNACSSGGSSGVSITFPWRSFPLIIIV